MTGRHIVLAVAAVLVLGLGIYLFYEVGRGPAAAQASIEPHPTTVHPTPEGDRAEPDEPEDPTATRVALGSGSANTNVFGSRLIRKTMGGAPRISTAPVGDPEETPAPDVSDLKPHKLDAIMAEANKAYDRGDFDDARSIALKVLKKTPGNTRMLRILVSSECIEGDAAEAQKHYLELPGPDREQMKTRCAKYDVKLISPPSDPK